LTGCELPKKRRKDFNFRDPQALSDYISHKRFATRQISLFQLQLINMAEDVLDIKKVEYPIRDYLREVTNRTLGYLEELGVAILIY
jgi:hypothetical protein